MEYISATSKDAEQIFNLVQRTIKSVYPKYYPKEVVDFFANCIAEKILPGILSRVLLVCLKMKIKL